MTTIDESTSRIKEDPSWLLPGALIGNGPYVLERWRYKRDARFERNPHFWNAENVANDSLEAVVIEDPNTAILAFEAGEVDWLPDVTADYRGATLADPRGRVAHEVLLTESSPFSSLIGRGNVLKRHEAQSDAGKCA